MDNKAFLFLKKLCLFNYREINVIRAVLVAISIPIFTSQLEKSREAVDIANIRAAYAEVAAQALTDPDKSCSIAVETKQTQPGWQTNGDTEIAGVKLSSITSNAKSDGTFTIAYTADGKAGGKITIDGVDISPNSIKTN